LVKVTFYLSNSIWPHLSSNFVQHSVVAQSFEQLTDLVYQILLHFTGFTHCA